ncbi:hypothetical protein [Oceanobacillus salinisoli]|uniref:hypothetical protein n=1 Tax=Oceanobacillus salinisoli TaxID=2678611 RepID=UPI0012E1D67F|nr:hypothetical protein [Oceanobacillus salinisoli]
MFDKDYTIKLISQVIKEEIIPSIDNSVVREQAIAMVSVLKNVNLNTLQNLNPYEEVNELLGKELSLLLEKVRKQEKSESELMKEYEIQLAEIEKIQNVKQKWAELNSLFSKIIKSLYHSEENVEEDIQECRRILRKQLNIEIKLVG